MAKKASLPDEIINEVLLKLPVKSLVRFRCVSKPWCILISDPHFAKTHYLNRTKTNHNQRFFISSSNSFSVVTQKSFVPWSLLYPRGDDDYDSDFDYYYDYGNDDYQTDDDVIDDDYQTDDNDAIIDFSIPSMIIVLRPVIVGSCDGLICTHCVEFNTFFVLNPSTRDCKELSHPGYFLNNTLDPIEYYEKEFFGFGYNSSIDDYRIVTIVTLEDDYDNTSSAVRVCSLRNNSWKIIQDCPYELSGQMGVYVSGAIHWTNSDFNIIVAFDLAEEEFKEVPLIHQSKPVEVETLGVHKGCLCMLQVVCEDSCLILWTMLEYGVGDSWIKLVIYPEILSGIDRFFPLDAENGKFLMLKGKVLSWYNFKEGTFEMLGIKNLSKESLNNAWFEVIKYEESLISPLAYSNNEIDD